MKSFDQFLNEGINDPNIFKAVFLAGGPGSGKSFVVGKTALTAQGLKLINSDIAFEVALEKAGLAATPENIYSDQGQAIRTKAKVLTNKRKKLALAGRLGLIIDGTGKDYDKIKAQKETLEKHGYECFMVFVNTNESTALKRNQLRSRSLPDQTVVKMWHAVQDNVGNFQNLFKNRMIIVDNSDNADANANTLQAYKVIIKWLSKPVTNPIAKSWMKLQK
jgi:predicted kinase